MDLPRLLMDALKLQIVPNPINIVFPYTYVYTYCCAKIANPRNHQGADTDANTRGFIYKLKLGPKYTDPAEQGLGPRSGFHLSFKDWSRGSPEGEEEFLKFCLHSDMGLSRALSSVLILIGASCHWVGLCSHSNMGFSRTLSCKLFSSCNWSNVNFSSYSQGPGMAALVLTLNLKWNGLYFLGLHTLL